MREQFLAHQIKWPSPNLVLVDALIAYPPYNFPVALPCTELLRYYITDRKAAQNARVKNHSCGISPPG